MALSASSCDFDAAKSFTAVSNCTDMLLKCSLWFKALPCNTAIFCLLACASFISACSLLSFFLCSSSSLNGVIEGNPSGGIPGAGIIQGSIAGQRQVNPLPVQAGWKQSASNDKHSHPDQGAIFIFTQLNVKTA